MQSYAICYIVYILAFFNTDKVYIEGYILKNRFKKHSKNSGQKKRECLMMTISSFY